MKAFQKIPIGKDESAEKRFISQVRVKARYINELYELITPFVKVEDKSTLQGNFYAQFIELFLAKYQSEFPPISVHKMLEAMEVNVKRIDELTKDIEAISIDLNKDLEAELPDFNIYTETEEQNKLYVTLNRLCKDINTLKDFGVRLSGNALIQGTQQMLAYDWAKQEMTPNSRRVLGKDFR